MSIFLIMKSNSLKRHLQNTLYIYIYMRAHTTNTRSAFKNISDITSIEMKKKKEIAIKRVTMSLTPTTFTDEQNP